MLVAEIDVGADVYHFAVVEQSEAAVTKPTAFKETAPGYEKLFPPLSDANSAVNSLLFRGPAYHFEAPAPS